MLFGGGDGDVFDDCGVVVVDDDDDDDVDVREVFSNRRIYPTCRGELLGIMVNNTICMDNYR